MRTIFFTLILLVILGSCNKFKYGEIPVTNCELCSYAKSIEGNYRGKASGFFFHSEPYSDSTTITVEHIFQNKGSFIDSNYMFLKMSYKFDNDTTLYIQIIELNDRSGSPLFSAYINSPIPASSDPFASYKGHYTITDSTISISKSVSGKYTAGYIGVFGGTFTKQ